MPNARVMKTLISTTLIVLICSVLPHTAAAQDTSKEPSRIRLKDGSFSSGRLVVAAEEGRLGWLAEGFVKPFEIDINAVRSVSANSLDLEGQQRELSEAGQLFEMKRGCLVAGKLLAIGDDWIDVDSPTLGKIQLARPDCLAIVDGEYAGQVVYSGPIDDDRWVRQSGADDWTFEGGALVAKGQGAVIVGQVDIPSKAQINMVLSWKGSPDFVLSMGTLASNKVSRPEEIPAAARLEVWDRQLALVREVEGGADIAMLSELNNTNPRVELTVYLDQRRGRVIVCDSHGRPLDTLEVPSERSIVRSSVHLANHGPALSIERFEVREWDGLTTTSGGKGNVLDSEGKLSAGAITGYDAEANELLIEDSGSVRKIPLSGIRRADIQEMERTSPGAAPEDEEVVVAPPVVQPTPLGVENASTNEQGQDNESEAELTAQPAVEIGPEVEVILGDRSRLRGQWLAGHQKQLRFRATGIQEPITFPPDAVRGVIGTSDRFTNDLTKHKNGTLVLESTQLLGYLAEQSQHDGSDALRWHLHASLSGSTLLPTTSGAIIYRKAIPKVPNRIVRIGTTPRIENLTFSQSMPNTTTQHDGSKEIMFRTGDAIVGTVEKIDEAGLTFSSAQTTTNFAPHEKVQHVWLNRNRSTSVVSAKKLERLMTVPRTMKQDPPTHLFMAITGDFLRGRLVSFVDDIVTVGIGLELVEIPAAKIAQIIWLHDRDWNEEDGEPQGITPDESAFPFHIHAIRSGDRGLTFQPTKLVNNVLIGTSDLLGDCSVPISDLNQLLFGNDIADEVRQFRDDPWTLSLAQSPRVFLEGAAGGPVGTESPMVGQPAPLFGLKTVDGESFRLLPTNDRIIVLDFWASWCGPCVQTMPQVDEIVAEIGKDKVHLVAVNIQEPATRVEAAIERLGIDATVLLDVDGQVAAAYSANAIPQTVIIDLEGNVTHLFVGGGARFVAQFKEALTALTASE